MNDKSPIDFPCDFTIKIMGAAHPNFENLAIDIAERHAEKVYRDKTTKKNSQKGDYVSVTVLVHFQNKAQMEALYQELRDNPKILMAL